MTQDTRRRWARAAAAAGLACALAACGAEASNSAGSGGSGGTGGTGGSGATGGSGSSGPAVVGVFPARVDVALSTSYAMVSRAADAEQTFTENFVAVDGSCGEGCGGPRQIGVLSASGILRPSATELELSSFEVRVQDVELTRRSNVNGFFFGDIVARLAAPVRGPVEVSNEGRTLSTRVTLDIELQLDVGPTAATAAPLFTADTPYLARGFSADLELQARGDGGWELAFRGVAEDAGGPLFELKFGTFEMALERAECFLTAVAPAR